MSLISKVSNAAYALPRWWWRAGSELFQYLTHDYILNTPWATRLLSIFLVLATAMTVTRWRRWSRRKGPPLPPGPRGLPIIGNLPFIGTELHRSFAKLAEIYGPIMKLQLGGKLCIVVTSPSLAKEIFNKHDTIFANHEVTVVGAIASYGGIDMAFSPYGGHWRMLRKVCVWEMLNHKRLEALYGLRRREARYMVRQLYSKTDYPVDVGEQSFLTAFNILASMLWGDTLEGEERRRTTGEVRRIIDRFMMLFGEPNISDLFPALAWLDIQGIGRRMKKTISWFDRMLDSIINERLKKGVERGSHRRDGCRDDEQDKDLLQVLLRQLKAEERACDNATPDLTMTHIKALFVDIMVAGTESTSTTVEWAMAELLKHPQMMKKVQEELEEVVGLNKIVEESHLSKLHYLHGVMKEVLRLHPPGPFLVPRCPSASCTVGGFMVPKGCRVIVNAWAIQRDPTAWDDPLEFKPERFLRSNDDEYDFSGKDFRYIPFGSGRRVCVGISLAERMITYLLASILHSFQWRLPDGVELDMSDKFGMELKKTTPLIAIPSPRLSDLTLYDL